MIRELLEKLYLPYVGKNPNLVIPDELQNDYNNFFKKEYERSGNSARSYSKKLFLRQIVKDENINDYLLLKKLIEYKYTSGFGLKRIASELNLSYTKIRNLFDYLEVDIRKGRNVVTDEVKKFRKEKAIHEAKTKTGWCSIEAQAKIKNKHTAKGVQGYYFSKIKNDYVWLRSTYEYIFAKWLDAQNIKWDIEKKTYRIGKILYRPDFFIYENDKLVKIIEIKGYWRDKEYKAKLLNEKLDIDVITVYDIVSYIDKDSSYGKELKEWKKIRKVKSKHENKIN